MLDQHSPHPGAIPPACSDRFASPGVVCASSSGAADPRPFTRVRAGAVLDPVDWGGLLALVVLSLHVGRPFHGGPDAIAGSPAE